MKRIFVDMDGVIVDFDSYKQGLGLTGDEVKRQPGAYLALKPIPGAIAAVQSLIGMGFEVWVATKPPTGIAFAYADKAEWIFQNLPGLKRRLILTHDKGLLGDWGDYLIDDRPHKANCEKFQGSLLVFGDGNRWPEILATMRFERDRLKRLTSEKTGTDDDLIPRATVAAMRTYLEKKVPE